MQYSNKSALKTPIINRVVYLNKQLAYYGRLLPHGRNRKNAAGEEQMTVDIRRCYFYPLLEKAGVLFTYAMRQLKWKDYLKRSIELIEEIQAQCYLIMELRVLSSLGLTLHPTKFYIQPVRHGVQFCGRVIYADKMYIGNRTLRACKNSIRLAIEHCSLENAYKLQCSFNSYVGFMCHCRSYNIQKMLMQMVLDSDYKKWLYFEDRKGRIVCEVKNEYKPKNIRIKELHEIREHQKLYEYEYRSKSKCSTKQRAA